MSDRNDDESTSGDGKRKREHDSLSTTIWDTVGDLKGYPLAAVAIQIAKENFALCLSKRFVAVDKKETTNHLEVIMNLKGFFAIDEMNKFTESYATSGVTEEGKLGIYFNNSLLERSNKAYEAAHEIAKGNIGGMLKDVEVVGIIAVLQETLEHELGHMKYHQEGIDDISFGVSTQIKKGDKFTPTEKPMRGEAGYTVQHDIRDAYFSNTSRFEPTIIGINEKFVGRKKRAARFDARDYEFQLCQIGEEESTGRLQILKTFEKTLEVADIAKHMDYPKGSSDCSIEIDFGGPPTGDEGKKGDGGEGGGGGGGDRDGGSGGGGGGTEPGRRRGGFQGNRETKWLDSVKTYLTKASLDAEMVWNPPEFNFCSNPVSESYIEDQSAFLCEPSREESQALIDRCQQCKIKIIPCDTNWNEKSLFATDEEIFAKLQITNVTEQLVLLHIGMVGAGFGRDGIQLRFANIDPGYSRGSNRNFYIPIDPGQTYTLLRHFTSGNKPSILCAYNTPKKAGMYKLRVEYYGKYFDNTAEIQVVENRA